jgi:hypothetical protein
MRSNSMGDDELPDEINGAAAKTPDPNATFLMKDLRFVLIPNILLVVYKFKK